MKTLIVIVVIIALAAVAGSIIIGVKSFDGVVAENPYEKGLAWDDVHKLMEELGWSVNIRDGAFRMGENDLIISIMDKYGGPLTGSTISVMRGRSATTEYDKSSDAVKLGEGLFMAPVNFPVYGYWNVRIEVTQKMNTIPFDKSFFVGEDASD